MIKSMHLYISPQNLKSYSLFDSKSRFEYLRYFKNLEILDLQDTNNR